MEERLQADRAGRLMIVHDFEGFDTLGTREGIMRLSILPPQFLSFKRGYYDLTVVCLDLLTLSCLVLLVMGDFLVCVVSAIILA